MFKNTTLQRQAVEYNLKRSPRARYLRLAIYSDGHVVVTAPYHLRMNIIEQFIIRKSRWILDKLAYFKNLPVGTLVANTKKNYTVYKSQALRLVQERIGHFNQTYRARFNRISIRNQRTRWGSCSGNGNLNFNYRIALLPARLADYIIVHELCHLQELNHSPQFWALVAKTISDYREIRRELSGRRLEL